MYDALYERIYELFELTTEGYAGHHGDTARVIHDCREAIRAEKGALGPWERDELDFADQAVRDNMLKLALNLAEKALDVAQLPHAEYEAGYNYGRPSPNGDNA